jgi:hypothetical protein
MVDNGHVPCKVQGQSPIRNHLQLPIRGHTIAEQQVADMVAYTKPRQTPPGDFPSQFRIPYPNNKYCDLVPYIPETDL